MIANNIDCPKCGKDAYVNEHPEGVSIDCPSCGFKDFQPTEL